MSTKSSQKPLADIHHLPDDQPHKAPDHVDPALYQRLRERVERTHLQQRLGLELHYETEVTGQGIQFFHLENWYSVHSFIRNSLRVSGLYWRGKRNALRLQINERHVTFPNLPPAFEGYRILHLSDLHIDTSREVAEVLIAAIETLEYDLCVITGDYRTKTFGCYQSVIDNIKLVTPAFKSPAYSVLGNHDTIQLLPYLEDLGIQVLLNESVTLQRAQQIIHLSGIDDAHYFKVDNIEKASEHVPDYGFSILLSHTPETYRQAAFANFDFFLCGHTHGGQICLPGGIPITWDARCPYALAKGEWRFHNMQGYTSVGSGTSIVDIRLNCLPEITVHTLGRSQPD